MSKRMLWLVCWAIPAIVAAGEPRTAPGGPREIRLPDCRIALIRQVTLACDRPGVVKSVEFREGDAIEARQQVVLIADEVARANLAIAEKKASNDVDVRFSEKARDVAEVEYQKNVEANKTTKAIAPLEIEKLKLAADKGVLAIEQAKNELALNKLAENQARAELATYSVIAPFSGVVTRVYKHPGEAVRQGDPILELVNIDRVRIEGRVSLADVRAIKLKHKVRVKLNDPDFDLPEESEPFVGRVTFVDVTVDPVTRETRVWAEVENRDNILRAGLMAEMVIEIAE
ncbi:MAG: efflux RND transporter periplasmic adaptor subunit [Planctomycetota bacterium]